MNYPNHPYKLALYGLLLYTILLSGCSTPVPQSNLPSITDVPCTLHQKGIGQLTLTVTLINTSPATWTEPATFYFRTLNSLRKRGVVILPEGSILLAYNPFLNNAYTIQMVRLKNSDIWTPAQGTIILPNSSPSRGKAVLKFISIPKNQE